ARRPRAAPWSNCAGHGRISRNKRRLPRFKLPCGLEPRFALPTYGKGAAAPAGRTNRSTPMTDVATAELPADRTLLIVEDDKSFLHRLARAMEPRGFSVTTAEPVADGLLQVEAAPPAFAVVDMRLGDGNGLDVISALKNRRPEARGIVLTGYGNIAT